MGQGYVQRVLTILEELTAGQEMLTAAVKGICTKPEKTRMGLKAATASAHPRTWSPREDRCSNIRKTRLELEVTRTLVAVTQRELKTTLPEKDIRARSGSSHKEKVPLLGWLLEGPNS